MTDAAAWEYSKNMSLEWYNNTASNRPKLNLPPTSLDTPNWDPKRYVPTPRNNIQDLDPGIRQAFVDRATGRHVSSVGGAIETVPLEIQRYQSTTPYRQVNQTTTRYQAASVDRAATLNRPSSAAPPPTPKTSGLTAAVKMWDPPPPAAPRGPLPANNPTLFAKPGGLPVSPGLLKTAAVGGAVGGVMDFGFRVASGQPLQQAAAGAVGSTTGSVAGMIVGTAVGGPIGGFVGGAIGGFIGGRIADAIWNLASPAPANFPSSTTIGPYLFLGGQEDGAPYKANYKHTNTAFSPAYRVSYSYAEVWGPIRGIRVFNTIDSAYQIQILSRGPRNRAIGPIDWYDAGSSTTGNFPTASVEVTTVEKLSPGPDSVGIPPSSPIPQDNRTPDSQSHPGNQNFAPPGASPAAGNSPAPNNYAPGGLKSRTNGTPRGDSPDWVSHGAPKGSPHPVNMPAPLLSPLPEFADPQAKLDLIPGLLPIPSNVPSIVVNDDGSVEVFAPSSPIATSDLQSFSLDQSFPISVTLTSPGGGFSAKPNEALNQRSATSLPTTTKSSSQPDATRTVPTSTAPPVAGQPQTGVTQKQFEDLQKSFTGKLDELSLGLVAITQIAQGLQQNTTPEAIKTAAAAGTCSTTEPGGCTTKAMNDAVKRGNDDLVGRLNLGGQALDLTLLGVINDKLGPQVPGGISSFLGRFAKSIHLDKIINALTLITALHNAAMLSRNLGSTLGDLTGQALSVIGLKDEEGDAIDVNKIFSKKVDELFVSILGESVWKGTKETWNKANAIISSTTQVMWTVRSLFDSGREILEWTAENTGKIGNALRRFRVVGENAYRWMPERVTATNVWAEKVNRAREGVDSLDDAASSLSSVLGEVQNIQQEYKELKEQKERFDKNLREFTPKEREDNEPVKAAIEAGRAASKAPVDAADVFRGEGETNA